MHFKVLLAAAAVGLLPPAAYADPSIIAGHWTIFPASGQSADAISAQPIVVLAAGGNGEDFAGLDLALSVDPIDDVGPVFELVEIGVGIFDGNHNGQTDFLPYGGPDQYSTTTTAAGTVGPNGVLALITFDATGVAAGTYNFNVVNFLGPSDLPPFVPLPSENLVHGTVTVLPEPGSIVLALMAVAGLSVAAVWRRRNR